MKAPSGLTGLLSRLFGLTRFIAELGVLSSAVLSLALYALSLLRLWPSIRDAFVHFADEAAVKHLLVAAVEQADVVLVATALLIISVGLHALFVGRVDQMPDWLHIESFDDLKQKLLGVVAAALAVRFFSAAVEWKSGLDILWLGLGISAVMLATAANVLLNDRRKQAERAHTQHEDEAVPAQDS